MKKRTTRPILIRHLIRALAPAPALLLSALQFAFAQCPTWTYPTSSVVDICDETVNESQLWNAVGFYDALNLTANLSDAPFQTDFVVSHPSCAQPDITFSLQLDLNGDGMRETEVNNGNILPEGQILYGNLTGAGTPVTFDDRSVNPANKYQFEMLLTPGATDVVARLVWKYVDTGGQTHYDPVQLPLGNHLLTWTAASGGDVVAKEVVLQVRDCRAPVLVCLNGLSANLMPTGVITLWNVDFLQYAEDNITSSPLIEISVRKQGEGTGYPVDQLGGPIHSITYDCQELGQHNVELWAKDRSGNTIYCETFVIIEDVSNFCNPVPEIVYQPATSCSDGGLLHVHFLSPAEGDIGADYLWNTGSALPYAEVFENGLYQVTITYPNADTDVLSFEVTDAPAGCGFLEGRVFSDIDGDCVIGSTNTGFADQTIKLTRSTGEVYYRTTDPNGRFEARLDAGAYDIEVISPNNLWGPCLTNFPVVITAGQVSIQDMILKPEGQLQPALSVQIGAPILRRCFSNYVYGTYGNQGTDTAEDAWVLLTLDPFLSLISASVPFTNLGNDQYRLELGDIEPGETGSFLVGVVLSCEAVLGQTHCMTADISPKSENDLTHPLWSGASLQINAFCETNQVRFRLENVGSAPMTIPLDYIVIEDLVMLNGGESNPLQPGDFMDVVMPANGSTWRVEANQEPNHPYSDRPGLSVEGCATGSTFSLGKVNQFPQDDAARWLDRFCIENIGSYDPNDKQGLPLGYGQTHQIGRNTDIEYMIRFQNTGTDTAFTVVVRDSLSPWLDIESLRPGPASHSYRMEYYGEGQNVQFVFDHIMLPDSNTNLAASQGFVTFRISQVSQVPFGTEIENDAAIYFDFNEAVITNTTRHRVDTAFVVVAAWAPVRPGIDLKIVPNPVTDAAYLSLSGWADDGEYRLELLDATGRILHNLTFTQGRTRIERGAAPAGLYTVRIIGPDGEAGIGKLIFK